MKSTEKMSHFVAIEQATQEQASSQQWRDLHVERITASNFGKILHRKSTPTEAFVVSLTSSFSKKVSAPSLCYGQRHESTAKAAYLDARPNVHLHKCGLVINPDFPFLGASPDAKVCDSGVCGIMEVKCPFSARQMTIAQASNDIPNFQLQLSQSTDSSSYKLKETHDNYAQIQGQLLVTGADFCDYVIYTQRDIHIERIYPNNVFMNDMLNKLTEFYAGYVKPYLEKLRNIEMQSDNDTEIESGAMVPNDAVAADVDDPAADTECEDVASTSYPLSTTVESTTRSM
jgi:hypothetical protein